MLTNQPGVYGLRDVAVGTSWLTEYRVVRANPTAVPPGGDTQVPTSGGLTLTAATGGVIVAFTRAGSAAVRLIPPSGGPGRIIKTITGPTATERVFVPFSRSEPAGVHRVVVTGTADGLSDEATLDVTITAPIRLARPVVRRTGARSLSVRITTGAKAVVRLVRADGRVRVLRRLTGGALATRIAIPADTRPGTYRVVVVALLAGRKTTTSLSLTL